MIDLNEFLTTALWSTIDYYRDENDLDQNLDDKYCIDDITDDFKAKAQKVCDEFFEKAAHLFTEDEIENSPIGHDLWLTIERHGAGFWDGDYVNGEALTEIAQSFPEMSDSLNDSIKRGDENEY